MRSSATAEDLPDASFAGQRETYLNVQGNASLLEPCRRSFASLFTDRAISYRVDKGFERTTIALSIGVQRMVRSDLGSAGVMFTIDTETGFRDAVLINAAYGLGENVVLGSVNPGEYYVLCSQAWVVIGYCWRVDPARACPVLLALELRWSAAAWLQAEPERKNKQNRSATLPSRFVLVASCGDLLLLARALAFCFRPINFDRCPVGQRLILHL